MLLKLGMTGPEVITLQKALLACGYELAVDGAFGVETLAAVKAFQAKRSLTVDGIAGPQTFLALAELSAPAVTPPSGFHVWDGASIVPGLDTSHYQREMQLADWQDMYARGFRWVYPKGADGTSGPDDYLVRSKALAKQAGFICCAGYDFFRFDPDPVAIAKKLFSVTGPVQVGELPPVLDVEWDNDSADHGYHDSLHNSTRGSLDAKGEDKAYACLAEMEQLYGMTPWLYTSAGFWVTHNAPRFARFGTIVANYGGGPDNKILVPKGLHMIGRQYSGTLKSRNGKFIDADRFEGTLAQLQGYVKK